MDNTNIFKSAFSKIPDLFGMGATDVSSGPGNLSQGIQSLISTIQGMMQNNSQEKIKNFEKQLNFLVDKNFPSLGGSSGASKGIGSLGTGIGSGIALGDQSEFKQSDIYKDFIKGTEGKVYTSAVQPYTAADGRFFDNTRGEGTAYDEFLKRNSRDELGFSSYTSDYTPDLDGSFGKRYPEIYKLNDLDLLGNSDPFDASQIKAYAPQYNPDIGRPPPTLLPAPKREEVTMAPPLSENIPLAKMFR